MEQTTAWRRTASRHDVAAPEHPKTVVPLLDSFSRRTWPDARHYATDISGFLVKAVPTTSPTPPPHDLRDQIATTVRDAHEKLVGKFDAHRYYLAWFDVRKPPFSVFVNLWDLEHKTALAVAHYSGSDRTDDPEPPIVESFRNKQSGDGERVLRFVSVDGAGKERPSSDSAVLSYAWRCLEKHTDVQIRVIAHDLGGLHTALADLDTFARGLTVD